MLRYASADVCVCVLSYKFVYDDGDKEDAVKRGNIRTDKDKRLYFLAY